MATIRVFDYLPDLDAFLPTPEYARLADRLGLAEWNSVVWIGRLFILDNDYGEHWFDNWDERAALKEKARQQGIDANELLIVVPDRFENGKDGPCHPPEVRKAFWTEVLKSLQLSDELLFAAARFWNERNRDMPPEVFPSEFYIAERSLEQQFSKQFPLATWRHRLRLRTNPVRRQAGVGHSTTRCLADG